MRSSGTPITLCHVLSHTAHLTSLSIHPTFSNRLRSQFKKTTQVVGKPGLTDHNHNDDAIKNPPNNHGDAPRGVCSPLAAAGVLSRSGSR